MSRGALALAGSRLLFLSRRRRPLSSPRSGTGSDASVGVLRALGGGDSGGRLEDFDSASRGVAPVRLPLYFPTQRVGVQFYGTPTGFSFIIHRQGQAHSCLGTRRRGRYSYSLTRTPPGRSVHAGAAGRWAAAYPRRCGARASARAAAGSAGAKARSAPASAAAPPWRAPPSWRSARPRLVRVRVRVRVKGER